MLDMSCNVPNYVISEIIPLKSTLELHFTRKHSSLHPASLAHPFTQTLSVPHSRVRVRSKLALGTVSKRVNGSAWARCNGESELSWNLMTSLVPGGDSVVREYITSGSPLSPAVRIPTLKSHPH